MPNTFDPPLEQALIARGKPIDRASVEYELLGNAAIKTFELSLATAGKLLRKALKSYTGDPRSLDRLMFNAALRQARSIACPTWRQWNAGYPIAPATTPPRMIMARNSPMKR